MMWHTYGCMNHDPNTTNNKGKKRGMMMSELHLELAELLDAGVDMWDRDEVYDAACERDYDLAATCIHDHWRDYVAFIEAWFLEDLLNEQVNA